MFSSLPPRPPSTPRQAAAALPAAPRGPQALTGGLGSLYHLHGCRTRPSKAWEAAPGGPDSWSAARECSRGKIAWRADFLPLARPPVPVLAAARGRATGPLGSNQRSLRRPPGPVWPPASAWRRRCARSRFLRGAKNGIFGGPARGRLRLRRNASPRGRGGRRGGAGTEGIPSYRIVAERARLEFTGSRVRGRRRSR